MRPVCIICNDRPVTMRASEVHRRKTIYRKRCASCRKRPYVYNKGDRCCKCGFVAEHSCQLDVDHIDGNHANNDISNLQTLCANCHRLKTRVNKDHLKNTGSIEIEVLQLDWLHEAR